MGIQDPSDPCRFCQTRVCYNRHTAAAKQCRGKSERPHKPRPKHGGVRHQPSNKLRYRKKQPGILQTLIQIIEGTY